MKVRFSSEARRYLAREAAYLRERSPSGAARFQRIVERARRQIASFPESGLTESIVAIAGARRIVVEEYLFDYDLADGVATIMIVRHSRNTPTVAIEPDADYEEPEAE
jgi:plasmid stabilization system protein ParE